MYGVWVLLWFTSFLCIGKVGDKKDPVPVQVPFLLPHEVLHELHRASALQVRFLQMCVFVFCLNHVLERQL